MADGEAGLDTGFVTTEQNRQSRSQGLSNTDFLGCKCTFGFIDIAIWVCLGERSQRFYRRSAFASV